MQDITKIKPNKVSTDPTSYSFWLAGPPKIGKSTFVQEMYGDKLLFIATEKRFGALDGANIVYVSNWAEFRMVLQQLKKPEAKAMYDSIAIDTVDNLVKYCEEFVAEHFDEDIIGEGSVSFGKDYVKVKDVWYKGMKAIESCGYNYCFISHVKEITKEVPMELLSKTDKALLNNNNNGIDDDDNIEYTLKVQDVPDKYLQTTAKMVDNIVFADNFKNAKGESERVLYLRGGLFNSAGVTLKDVPMAIPFDVQHLKDTFKKSLNTYKSTTDEKKTHSDIQDTTYNYEDLMKEVVDIATEFKEAGKMKEINKVVEGVLGKGQKVNDLKASQVKELALVVEGMKEAHKKLED